MEQKILKADRVLPAHVRFTGVLKCLDLNQIEQAAYNINQLQDGSFCNVLIVFSMDSDGWLETTTPFSNKIYIHEVNGVKIENSQAWINCTGDMHQTLVTDGNLGILRFILNDNTYEITDIKIKRMRETNNLY